MKTLIMTFFAVLAAVACGQSASELYQTHCSHCHGINFQGGNAQSLVDGIWQFGGSTGHISSNIKNGITHLGMPAYEKTLTGPQTKSIAEFLLNAEKEAGAVKPPIPETLQTLDYTIDVEIWAEGLEIPWDIAFLDADTALITERPGRLRVVDKGKLYTKPVEGTPKVVAEGQGGLLAVAFDPDYTQEGNQWVYLAYSHGLEMLPNGKRAPAMTKVVRGRINGNTWADEQVLFEAKHDDYRTTRHHYGTRIVFDADKNLYFSIGDRGTGIHAQDLSKPNGKIHRIQRDGVIPKGNPFRRKSGALPSIYTYGNRNPQGISVHPVTGKIWASEHGPLGGDEINLIAPGKNYGWPIITYGKNYNGSIITEFVRKDGMEQPVWYWNPSTAVCGIDFYHGDLFPKWNNKLLVGALKYEDVRVLDIEGSRVMHEEVILKNAGRVRDVACGPDGAVYVVLNDPGTILRLTPKKD
ncbi:PQQ-dependent sugar dehydrogenase [Pontiella sulfatireligans]|uniref:Aldose sugar dehydrogenase YliI n=1 Tax=Pontiella sulfatireligans TaxID=2750658 RepID=A0A6C2UNS0_9BACT|nr:PQQ-dependent sugar dehydrogenase [Pontiella sulfatireligans]VGO21709.1 Aldose sugar dehydrogenase YliI [Pontiella sulfatireligans]